MAREYNRQDPTCSMCDKPSKAKGLCATHYMQQRRHGVPDDDRWEKYRAGLLEHGNRKYRPGEPCTAPDCDRPILARDLCSTHYTRLRYKGDVGSDVPIRVAKGWHIDSNGYKVLGTGPNKRYEHRVVMEQMLGRPLDLCENVHHRNGQRADNRSENLELWVKPQPQGQRVEDLVTWVVDHYGAEVELALKERMLGSRP